MTIARICTCPVCAFSGMDEPPIDHAICACCGTEFGYQDVSKSYLKLRNEWLSKGGHWFDTDDPAYPSYGLGWNAWDQLDRGGYIYGIPRPSRVSAR